ncbi:NAD(P)-binding domain-containing protein [uncultured Paraglaciecola sp.]|uniref:flavin-containing monooxygenase n=1 Tax=uncultured Paraglaciecola sp. TaxID=1765024 RepID=UPI002603363D|nr:NAD(P)-binding domain-containing protein [uncultured Paraglaciecola sp.]
MTELTYALIGAGPMGLATARQLQKYGIVFEGFELHSDIGGLWDITNPHSTMYESAHLISSKHMTEFTEFPMAAEVATYPKHSDICQYFQDYAHEFELKRYFSFGCKVTAMTPLDNGQWQLSWTKDGQSHSKTFAGVLLANGNLHKPNIPTIPGDFSGELLHSNQYKHPQIFKNKRVLIVGCGNSACDIAIDAVHHAQSVDISVRRGYYFLPKFALGKAIDSLGGKIKLPKTIKQFVEGLLIKILVGKPSDYGLPEPDYKMYESHPVINSLVLHHLGHGDIKAQKDIQKCSGQKVTFADKSEAEYDLILMATGYKLDFPFIDKALLNWQQDAPDLFLNVFNPEQENVFVMGMVEAAGLGWQGRAEQAQMVAMLLKLKQTNKPETIQWFKQQMSSAQHDTSGGMNYLKVARMAYYVHKDSYLKSMRTLTARFQQALDS